jgi:hypothetical protein
MAKNGKEKVASTEAGYKYYIMQLKGKIEIMCGRFVLCSPTQTIVEEFRVDRTSFDTYRVTTSPRRRISSLSKRTEHGY